MLPETWMISELLSAVESNHGREQANLLLPPVASIPWKIQMALYHAECSLEAFAGTVPGHSEDPRVAATIQLLKEAAGAEEKPLRTATFEAEAHTIACCQAMHSAIELFGLTIYYALALNHDPATIRQLRRISARSILALITPRYSGIANELEQLLQSHEHHYLQAFVNTTKHRSLVAAGYSVDFAAGPAPRQGFRISSFEYESDQFDSTWSARVVSGDIQELRRRVVDIGSTINCAAGA